MGLVERPDIYVELRCGQDRYPFVPANQSVSLKEDRRIEFFLPIGEFIPNISDVRVVAYGVTIAERKLDRLIQKLESDTLTMKIPIDQMLMACGEHTREIEKELIRRWSEKK